MDKHGTLGVFPASPPYSNTQRRKRTGKKKEKNVKRNDSPFSLQLQGLEFKSLVSAEVGGKEQEITDKFNRCNNRKLSKSYGTCLDV